MTREPHKPAGATGAFCADGALVPGATAAAQSGSEHVEVPTAYDGILLLGFGGPESQDDVIPFLRNVTRGRGIPDERLEEVAQHYRHFGGVSPINEHNRQLRAALGAELAARGLNLPVYWGNRNWPPYVNSAVIEAHAAGHRRLLAIATSAFSSFSSCRQYREDLADALEDAGLGSEMQIDKVRPFFDHPGFLSPVVEGLRAAIESTVAELPGLDPATELEVLFCTHSIPLGDAGRSGPPERSFGGGGAYEAQHLAAARAVMAQLEHGAIPWQLVFQSRSGPPTVPWLEPDVNDAIRGLPGAGRRAAILVPLGFLSDHMEVLWDLDTEAMETAAEAGLAALRVPSPGIHPAFVAGLADLVEERLYGTPASDRPHLTDLGPWYDVCRPGCCENARLGFRPALAGLAP
jgi:ferrochelatase